jgi:membrane peptidoglycan carboxypeptidase
LIGLAVLGFITLSVAIAILSIGLPDVNDLDKLSVAQSTTIYDRENNVLYVKHGGENRKYVPYDHISETLINATVALEDDEFWEHKVLASLPQRPSYYDPYGQYKNSKLTRELSPEEIKSRNIRQESDLNDNEFLRGLIGSNIRLDETHSVYIQGRTDLVLKSMRNLGYITEQEMEKALEDLQIIEFNEYIEKIEAPHFVFYVIDQLEEKYGKELVEQGGLQVYTSIDPTLQEYAEEAVEVGTGKNAASYNVKNGALVSLDPKTGEILAMVGSKDYFAEDIDGAVNVTTNYRQPGSSFKPIVFAQAFYNRYAPASVVFDIRTRFGANSYPNNYDGGFMGPISIRKALGQSRNIPAIKAYFLAGEQEEIIKLSQKMGINFLEPEKDYGWPLALGTAEARPLDMASAFGVFANTGVRHEPIAILKIENAQGEILEEHKPEMFKGEEVLDPQVAYLINNILSDKSVGLGDNLVVPGKITAAKTGTSNVKENGVTLPRDMWTIGYSPNLVTAVWTGNNSAKDGKPSASATGLYSAAPIWKSYMTKALENTESEDFYMPEGITTASVSKLTGKLPGPNTPEHLIIEEIFASFSVPTEVDEGFTEVEIDSRNNKLTNAYCPPKFVKTVSFMAMQAIAPIPAWQEAVDAWLEANSAKLLAPPESGDEEGTEPETSTIGDIIFGYPPKEVSELCTQENLENKPKIDIISPKSKEEIESGTNVAVEIQILAPNNVEQVQYYLNDNLQYTAKDYPYYGTIRLPKGEIANKDHTIKAIVTDQYGYTGEKSVDIRTTKNSTTTPLIEPTGDDPPKEDPPSPSPIDEQPPESSPLVSEPSDLTPVDN